MTNTTEIKTFLLSWQDAISQMLQQEDEQLQLIEDPWQYPQGGGGITRVFKQGKFIDKAGVNFSHVMGTQLPAAATQQRPEIAGQPFEAMGVSTVVHPHNPFAPTTHANLRFFQTQSQKGDPVWWFGGGFDLTPYYGFKEDCCHWHQMAHRACAPFGDEIYPSFKKWADDYFYLPHRKEHRGIGGLFFDDLNGWDMPTCFTFLQSVGAHFIQGYQPILNRRKNTAFTEQQKHFQLLRRGRYVEFNLLYDRGTLFGLQSGGRTESILMSLPALVRWEYGAHFPSESPEALLTDYYLKPQEWAHLNLEETHE